MTALAPTATLARSTEVTNTPEILNPSWQFAGDPKITHLGEGILPVFRNITEQIGLVIDWNRKRELLQQIILDCNQVIELFPNKFDVSKVNIDTRNNNGNIKFSFNPGNGDLIEISKDPNNLHIINIKILYLHQPKIAARDPNAIPPSLKLHYSRQEQQIRLLHDDNRELASDHKDYAGIMGTVKLFTRLQGLFPKGLSFDGYFSMDSVPKSDNTNAYLRMNAPELLGRKKVSTSFESPGFANVQLCGVIEKK